MKGENSGCGCVCSDRPSWMFLVLVLVVVFGGFYFLSTMKTASVSSIYLSANESAVPEPNTISVSGSANEKVEPDMLVITFYVQAESKSAKDAQSKNAEISNAIIASLKSLGVDEKEIKTDSYYVNKKQESHYICSNESGKSDCYWTYVDVGYVATHQFIINIYDLTKGGAAVDAIGSAGGEVGSVSFDLKPQTRKDVTAKLLSVAAAEARKKADAIASGTGVSIVRPLSISESYSSTPIYYQKVMYASNAAESVPTPLQSGTIDISVSVNAVFEMK